jgi:hypothetical protein
LRLGYVQILAASLVARFAAQLIGSSVGGANDITRLKSIQHDGNLIQEKDLNQKIARFRQLLRDPRQDPRSQAHELYLILIVPVKADWIRRAQRTLSGLLMECSATSQWQLCTTGSNIS